MTVQILPNAEALIGDHLRDDPAITALQARVAGRIPRDSTAPWVVVTQLDGAAVGNVEHLISYLIQFDCYAGADATREHVGQSEASLLARTVRGVLLTARGAILGEEMVVSGVRFVGMARIPDDDFETTRERYVLTAEIHAHPVA